MDRSEKSNPLYNEEGIFGEFQNEKNKIFIDIHLVKIY